jgi:Glycosyl transferase family 2
VTRERITACLIVQDEQEHLPAALASVAFCDEIVVVDGGSRDRTVEIAREAGAKVIENPWPGYAAQRNVALDGASGDWVVEVDADEQISPRLRASIEAMLEDTPPEVVMALCPLRHRFLGGQLGSSAKYPAYRARIFRLGAYRHDESRAVHEGVQPRERPLILEGDLEHELAGRLGEALRDMLAYARLESRHVTPPAARGYVTGILMRPLAKLFYRVVVDRGWSDGWRGMLKISLDVVSDALVWVLVLIGRQAAAPMSGADVVLVEGVESNGAVPEHFGRRRVGQPKVLAIAARGRPAREAREWLAALGARGIDVVLVTDEPAGEGDGGSGSEGGSGRDGQGVPMYTVDSFRPFALMRAIDLETQVRELDALVAFGRRARFIRRLLPPTFRPEVPGLSPTSGIEQSVELAHRLVTPPAVG